MPEVDSENPPKEMSKYGVQCRCHEPGHVVPDEELVKLADGSMECQVCGQRYMFRGQKSGEACSATKA